MAFCERAGLTAAARQVALAAMDAVHEAVPAGTGLDDSSDDSWGPRVLRQGRLAGNLFAYCLQAGEYEVGLSLSRPWGSPSTQGIQGSSVGLFRGCSWEVGSQLCKGICLSCPTAGLVLAACASDPAHAEGFLDSRCPALTPQRTRRGSILPRAWPVAALPRAHSAHHAEQTLHCSNSNRLCLHRRPLPPWQDTPSLSSGAICWAPSSLPCLQPEPFLCCCGCPCAALLWWTASMGTQMTACWLSQRRR